MKLLSDYLNACDHNKTTLPSDGWTYRPTDDIAATCVLRAVGLKAKWL